MKKTIFLSSCFILFCSGLLADISYGSQLQQEIGTQIQLAQMLPSTIRPDTCYRFRHPQKKDMGLYALTDAGGSIIHIGCALFARLQNPSELSCFDRFIERYLLESYLPLKGNIAFPRRMQSDDVILLHGQLQDLLQMTKAPIDAISYHYTDLGDRMLFNLLLDERVQVSLSLPKNYSLLTGKTLLELEESLFSYLQDQCPPQTPAIDTTRLQHIFAAPFSMLRGDYFLTETLNNNLYVQATKTGYSLFYSPDYPRQTLANILLAGSVQDYKLAIRFHTYGRIVKKLTVPVNSWIRQEYDEGCVPFFGIEKTNNGRITAAYYWVNFLFGYAHIMEVELDKRTLSMPSLPIRTSLHAYVRLTNIANINSLIE